MMGTPPVTLTPSVIHSEVALKGGDGDGITMEFQSLPLEFHGHLITLSVGFDF